MTPIDDRPRHSRGVSIVLTVVVGAITTVVAYLGARENTRLPEAQSPAFIAESLHGQTIMLPHYEPELPLGPNQRTFAVSCTICHSTRLVMTQPPLSREQWTAIVQKMIKTYGAPVEPAAAEQILEYLTAVHGK
jgi:hypothetical protein